MKVAQGTHFFRLTKREIKNYKAFDPLERTRNPRPGLFITQWDINWGICNWFLAVIFLGLAFVIDVICLPFQIIKTIFSEDGNNRKRGKIKEKDDITHGSSRRPNGRR